MEKLQTSEGSEVFPYPKKSALAPKVGFAVRILVVILFTGEILADKDSSEKPKTTGIVPLALGDHPENQESKSYQRLKAEQEALLEASELSKTKPKSEKEVRDLLEIAQELKIAEMMNATRIRNSTYAAFIRAGRKHLRDIYFEVSPPSMTPILDTKRETPVTYHVLPSTREHPIIYISFDDFCGENLIPELKKLLDGKTYDHIILDLRDNCGGLLENATAFLDLFFKAGETPTILTNGEESSIEMKDDGNEVVVENGFLVLVNGRTASMAEMSVIGFQTLGEKKAVVTGDPTKGKWSLQRIFILPSGMQVKTTFALWEKDMPGSGVGIKPDIKRMDLLRQLLEKENPTPEEIQEFHGFFPVLLAKSAQAEAFFKKD